MLAEEIIYVDLFSGIGGFAKGFEDAGLKFDKHYFSEIDKHAIAVYIYQFKNSEHVGSIENVSGTKLRKKHPKARFIITFGFPCQDLSIAGKGEGLDGARSGLFFEAIRLVKEIKPEVFIFENVKGLLSNNEGKDFETVLRTIADLGLYECEWQLVNTSWILPQNRERVYFVGHLAGRSIPRVFPFRENDFVVNESFRKKTKRRSRIQIQSNRNACSLNQRMNKMGVDDNYINVIPVLTPDRKEKRQNGRRFKENGEPAFTLNTQDMHGVMITSHHQRKGDPKKGGTGPLKSEKYSFAIDSSPHRVNDIRRLTEIESERLQGFPDNWTQFGNYDGTIKKVSKTQRYKQCGNAVTTNIPRMIAKRLFK